MRLTGLRRPAARAVGVVGLLLTTSAAVATAGGPASVPIGRCTARRGTLVAVSFAHWGGPVVRGCAPHARTAYAALHAVGITTAGDDHDGSAFVCRLGDGAFHHGAPYPTDAQQSCLGTPSATGYWSSWSAPAGATRFDYSQLGAMSEPARPGEIELWTFGATNVAGTSGSGVPRLAPGAIRAASAAGVRFADATTSAAPASSGSPTGLVVGVGVALALVAAAAVTTVRRRRQDG